MAKRSNRVFPCSLTAALIAVLLVTSAPAQHVPTAKPESVGMSAERFSRLTAELDRYVLVGRLSGGVAMAARRGKLVYTHVFGKRDQESGDAMRADTLFRAASQSKLIISIGIMVLQEEGRLLVTDPVSKFIPEFRETTVAVPKTDGGYDVVKAKRQITIRDLLTHTAGVGYGEGVARDKWEAAGITTFYTAHLDEPITATAARMASLPMDAHPGEKYVYGYGHDILGAVIEKASGQDLQDYLSSRIYRPLGMNDTCFFLDPAKSGRLAVVYSPGSDGKIVRSADPGKVVGQGHFLNGPRKSYSGGAGILTTAGDYLRLLLMLSNGGELDGRRVLSRKSVELLSSDHLNGIAFRPGQGFGFGVSVVKDLGARGVPGSVGEWGWGGAYHSTFWIDPKEQLVVVYFTQLIPAGNIDDHGKLRALIYQSIVD